MKGLTRIHQLHPRLCRHPLAPPGQYQPTGETVSSAFGPLVIAVFTTLAAHEMDTSQGSAAHSIPLAPSAPPSPAMGGWL